jgi:hypothetical protein
MAGVEYFTPLQELDGFVPPFTMVSYGSGTVPPIGSGVPKGPVPNSTYDQIWYAQNPSTSIPNGHKSGSSASDIREQIWQDLRAAFKKKMGIDITNVANSYKKPHNCVFDIHMFPPGFRAPDFVKFFGADNKSTREHISQFLAQLGDLFGTEAFRIRLFSLSLTGSAFAWYSSLPPNSINSWDEIEAKFHDHFFSDEYELEFTDLSKIQQGREESVHDYLKRFRDTRNCCFQ